MTFLELFAGAGGAHLGLVRAGHTVVRAVEWNTDAAATLAATGAEVYCGDVRHSDAYLGLPPVDALWASPPCQDWSSAGKREGANGSRNGWRRLRHGWTRHPTLGRRAVAVAGGGDAHVHQGAGWA